MNHTIRYEVQDATEGSRRRMEIVTDQHGLTIHLDTTCQDIIVDFDKGNLRVFLTDANGDVIGSPIGYTPVGVRP